MTKTSIAVTALTATFTFLFAYLLLTKPDLPQEQPSVKPSAPSTGADKNIGSASDQQVGSQPPVAPESKPFRELSLTEQEMERFLAKHGRSGPSLIAAFSVLNNLKYLQEAIQRAPESPEVALAALAAGEGPDAIWIQRLERADPDNALAQFLASYSAFQGQNGEQALGTLKRAQLLPEFDDYNEERMQMVEEAALDSGYPQQTASALAAKSANLADALLPKYLEYAELVSSHLSNYRDNPKEVDWILQAALKLGSELKEERPGRSVFVQAGAALYEKALYEGISESAPFPSLNENPATLANQSLSYKQELVQLRQASTAWFKGQSNSAIVEFFRKKREQGEQRALLWALGK